MNHTNRTKGARKIDRFEKEGEISRDFLVKLATLLDIRQAEIKQHIAREEANWER